MKRERIKLGSNQLIMKPYNSIEWLSWRKMRCEEIKGKKREVKGQEKRERKDRKSLDLDLGFRQQGEN